MSISLDKFKPLLSATIETKEDFDSLVYPLWASPKLDGIRAICHPTLGPVTRSLKPIPNKFIRQYLSDPRLHWLDGEVIVGEMSGEDVYNRSQSGVMSQGGNPDFTYYVFDHFGYSQLRCPFNIRKIDASAVVHDWKRDLEGPDRVEWLSHYLVNDRQQLNNYEEDCLASGYEGIMLRTPTGRYKFNRSTLKEQILMKLKRFEDAEGRIVGWEPLLRNENAAYIDERGYQKRSSHQAGKIPDDTRVGKFNAIGINGRWKDIPFDCGSGMTDDDRLRFRKLVGDNGDPGSLKDATFTYKFQPYGSKDAPRIPIWKGLRAAE